MIDLELEGLAWSRRVLGEAGPHVRAVAPQVLVDTHNLFAANNADLGLATADAYGLMWLGVPRALVAKLGNVAGVRLHRPKRARYQIPVVNGVPLVPWRYAKDRTTRLADVPFGDPVSDSRRSMFQADLALPLELELGMAGLGDAVIAELPVNERTTFDSYLAEIRELAETGRVAVLGYASTPDALLRAHFGYADLDAHDCLVWAFCEELTLAGLAASTPRPAVPSLHDTFDSGPIGQPILRPRATESDTP